MTIDREELKEFLKNSVEWLQETDEGCCTYPLDDRLAVCVGWTSGWGEEQRDDCIQSKDNNDWAIDAGIKVYTSDDMRTDYEFINSPYRDNGEVATDDTAVTPKDVEEDYERLLDYLINEYEGLKDLTIEEDGKIVEKTTDYEEDDNIEESFRKVDEDLKVVCEFGDYKPWSGAIEVYEAIEEAGKLDELESLLEEAYPEGISMTGINDILWFDSDWVYENLGMNSEEDVTEDDTDESLEEEKEHIDESLNEEPVKLFIYKTTDGGYGFDCSHIGNSKTPIKSYSSKEEAQKEGEKFCKLHGYDKFEVIMDESLNEDELEEANAKWVLKFFGDDYYYKYKDGIYYSQGKISPFVYNIKEADKYNTRREALENFGEAVEYVWNNCYLGWDESQLEKYFGAKTKEEFDARFDEEEYNDVVKDLLRRGLFEVVKVQE